MAGIFKPAPTGFLTPATLPASKLCRVVSIPDDLLFIAAFSGALWQLTEPENWQDFGEVTTEEAAAAAREVIFEFWDSVCEPAGDGDMELIGEIVLTSNAGLIGFGNIPDTYRELWLQCSARSNVDVLSDAANVILNAVDAGGAYRWAESSYNLSGVTLTGQSDFADDTLLLPRFCPGAGAYFIQYGYVSLRLPNYAEQYQRKTIVGEAYNPTGGQTATHYRRDMYMAYCEIATAKIEQITLEPVSGTEFVSGSQFRLYGLKGAPA